MREKIIEIIANYNNFAISAFKNRLPEIHGDLNFVFPMKNIENSNVLLVSGVNGEFIKTVIDLINEDILSFMPTGPLVVAADGGEIYDLPFANIGKGFKGYKNLHWLPLLLKKGDKFYYQKELSELNKSVKV
jgi:hypothetical protein